MNLDACNCKLLYILIIFMPTIYLINLDASNFYKVNVKFSHFFLILSLLLYKNARHKILHDISNNSCMGIVGLLVFKLAFAREA